MNYSDWLNNKYQYELNRMILEASDKLRSYGLLHCSNQDKNFIAYFSETIPIFGVFEFNKFNSKLLVNIKQKCLFVSIQGQIIYPSYKEEDLKVKLSFGFHPL